MLARLEDLWRISICIDEEFWMVRRTDDSVDSTVQSTADELYEGVSQVDYGSSSLRFDVFPFVRRRVHYLEAAQLIE